MAPKRGKPSSVRDALATTRIIERLRLQHGAEKRQQTISQSAQGATVTVALVAEPMIVLATSRIVLHAHARPMVERITEAKIATIAHEDRCFFSALPRDGATPA